MLNKFKKFLQDAASESERLLGRIKDRGLFTRVVEASYLIAIADGDFSADEKTALARLVQDKLPRFTLDDVMGVLDNCERKMNFDPAFGKQEIIQNVCKARGDDADLIVRTSCFIGASDGDFDDNEKAVVRELCRGMEVRAETYGL